ncbi:NnrS family protein [Salicola sp. Rm-C-2C1-2]|uniref:NnrS family protein n=1 Tax=Salicola sp. Rm-C-2C1-2 TaxID=3141321 RepID=UPI0032E3BB45
MAEPPNTPPRLSPVILFSYPFRIFFLSLAVQAVAIIPLWVGTVTGRLDLPLALPALAWHQHEMIFAWLQAAIAGFLLTAVCVWTGTSRTQGWPLAGLWGVWLMGRLLITLGESLPEWLVIGVNLLFIPLVMLDAGLRVWRARQPRQLPILLVLLGLWVMQTAFLVNASATALDGALIMAITLMLIIGGRITPNFSQGWLRARGLPTEGITVTPWLEKSLLAVMALTFLAVLTLPDPVTGALAIVAGTLALVRILLWRGWRVAREPLLWILHLSLLWIPVGLWLLAASRLGGMPETVWTHAIGLGAMGGLILGVISRVALGHTGRIMTLPGGMVTAFVMIHAGALLRVATGAGGLVWQTGISVSAVLWTIAFGLYLFRYTGILMRPRVDGKAG